MRSVSPKSMVLRTIASARYVRDLIKGQLYGLPSVLGDNDRPLRPSHRGHRPRDPQRAGAGGPRPAALLRDDAVPPRPRRTAAGWRQADATVDVRPRL